MFIYNNRRIGTVVRGWDPYVWHIEEIELQNEGDTSLDGY